MLNVPSGVPGSVRISISGILVELINRAKVKSLNDVFAPKKSIAVPPNHVLCVNCSEETDDKREGFVKAEAASCPFAADASPIAPVRASMPSFKNCKPEFPTCANEVSETKTVKEKNKNNFIC